MTSETFRSGGKDLKITVFPAPGDGKRHPMVLLIHGNFGLGPPYGDQIRGFGKSLAELGYVAAVPNSTRMTSPTRTTSTRIPTSRRCRPRSRR